MAGKRLKPIRVVRENHTGMLMTRTIDLVELPFRRDKNDDNDEHVYNLFRHRTHSHGS